MTKFFRLHVPPLFVLVGASLFVPSLFLSGCPLENAEIGRTCFGDEDCSEGYRCALDDNACAPNSFFDGNEPEQVEPSQREPDDVEPDNVEPADGGVPEPAPEPESGNTVVIDSENPTAGGEFGSALALDGTTLVIGAPSEDRVYIYDVSGPVPSLMQELAAPASLRAAPGFGTSVAISGDVLFVGAPFGEWEPTPEEGMGQGLLYVRSGTNFELNTQIGGIFATDAAYFGTSAAMIEGALGLKVHLVVGEPGFFDSASGLRTGAVNVYSFTKITNTLSAPSVLLSPIPNPSSAGQTGNFGEHVAFGDAGGRLAVAAPDEDIPGANDSHNGRVYVFLRDPVNNFDDSTTIEGPNPSIPATFGASVTYDSLGRLFVGQANFDQNRGRVLEFAAAPGFEPVLEPIEPSTQNLHFGRAIAIHDRHMVVGAARPIFNFIGTDSSISRFDRTTGAYNLSEAPNPGRDFGSDDRYGAAVAVDEQWVVVGAPGATISLVAAEGAVVLIQR